MFSHITAWSGAHVIITSQEVTQTDDITMTTDCGSSALLLQHLQSPPHGGHLSNPCLPAVLMTVGGATEETVLFSLDPI